MPNEFLAAAHRARDRLDALDALIAEDRAATDADLAAQQQAMASLASDIRAAVDRLTALAATATLRAGELAGELSKRRPPQA